MAIINSRGRCSETSECGDAVPSLPESWIYESATLIFLQEKIIPETTKSRNIDLNIMLVVAASSHGV